MERQQNCCRSLLGGRAEIDTRAPFVSVKQAVALFGEKILAGEIYATRLREIQTKEAYSAPSSQSRLRLRSLTFELEQMKQTLTKTLQLNTILSNQIQTLTQELEHRRKEIERLNMMRTSRLENPEIEEFKFLKHHQTKTSKDVEEEVIVTSEELEKRRLVTFASSPLLTRVMSSVETYEVHEEERNKKEKVLKQLNSVKNAKSKKGFAPFMGWFRATRKE